MYTYASYIYMYKYRITLYSILLASMYARVQHHHHRGDHEDIMLYVHLYVYM